MLMSSALQWLLVLRPLHCGISPPRLSCRYQEMPDGLGHHNARTQSVVAARPQRTLLSVRQNVRPNAWGVGSGMICYSGCALYGARLYSLNPRFTSILWLLTTFLISLRHVASFAVFQMPKRRSISSLLFKASQSSSTRSNSPSSPSAPMTL